jgi:hypothetical protein
MLNLSKKDLVKNAMGEIFEVINIFINGEIKVYEAESIKQYAGFPTVVYFTDDGVMCWDKSGNKNNLKGPFAQQRYWKN